MLLSRWQKPAQNGGGSFADGSNAKRTHSTDQKGEISFNRFSDTLELLSY
jgi:hypothetical protein